MDFRDNKYIFAQILGSFVKCYHVEIGKSFLFGILEDLCFSILFSYRGYFFLQGCFGEGAIVGETPISLLQFDFNSGGEGHIGHLESIVISLGKQRDHLQLSRLERSSLYLMLTSISRYVLHVFYFFLGLFQLSQQNPHFYKP